MCKYHGEFVDELETANCPISRWLINVVFLLFQLDFLVKWKTCDFDAFKRQIYKCLKTRMSNGTHGVTMFVFVVWLYSSAAQKLWNNENELNMFIVPHFYVIYQTRQFHHICKLQELKMGRAAQYFWKN